MMTFVTLGTQDKQFKRLLTAVEEQAQKGNLDGKIIVQSGCTPFASDLMDIVDYTDMEQFDQYIRQADLIITHGGVGTIIAALKQEKTIIACARLAKYKEHHNDHQRQIIESFSKLGYLLSFDEEDDLEILLQQARCFKPKPFQSNTAQLIALLRKDLQTHL